MSDEAKKEINTGGPAFPQARFNYFQGEWRCTFDLGMSLRDYLAAHAPSMPPGFMNETPETSYEKRFFKWRWYYADQMLKARGGE